MRAATLALLGLFAASPVAADPCDALDVPAELNLSCTPDGSAALTLQPAEGLWAALSRLSVRELSRDQESDAAAWSDPDAWLRSQLAFDLAALVESLKTQAGDPDSPFGNSAIDTTLAGIADAIEGWTRLAEEGCEPIAKPGEAPPQRHELSCHWDAGPLALGMLLRVEVRGERRWSVQAYAMNEKRLRHFTAIANGFEPDRW